MQRLFYQSNWFSSQKYAKEMPNLGSFGKWKKIIGKNKGNTPEVINEKPLHFC
jgi:hypothetical protein